MLDSHSIPTHHHHFHQHQQEVNYEEDDSKEYGSKGGKYSKETRK